MNKTILALLLIAAAGGTAWYFSSKSTGNAKPEPVDYAKEICTTWKTDSLYSVKKDTLGDINKMGICSQTSCTGIVLSFTTEGKIYVKADSTHKADTFSYQWKNDSLFHWVNDSLQAPVTVKQLSGDSLVLETGTKDIIWLKKQAR
jgi:hypothetical protein